MLPLKLPVFGKDTFVLQQKLLFYLVFGLFVFVFVGCNSSNSGNAVSSSDTTLNGNNTSMNTASGTAKAAGLDATFHNLYLSKKEFDTLFSNASSNQYKKFVFQFLFPEYALEGSPTLALWLSRNKNSAFTKTPQQILHYAQNSRVDLPKNIYLGDLQTNIDSLKIALDKNPKCQDSCVLYFVPREDSIITYKIYLVVDSTTIATKALRPFDYSSETPIGEANPSPPAGAN